MTSAFQFHLMLIVLMNIMFVHITGAVGMNWLVPMYAMTLVSPLLVRLQENLLYRIAWNVGVCAIFAVLLIDAMTTGITFLLEDGLILAAFCQVHLLNVIRRHAGADLLFFNSFLIALVTSLFCQDLVFSAVFAIYAVVLLIALHMGTIASTQHRIDSDALRVVMRHSFGRAVAALVLTGLVFALMPRDFRRQGFVGDDILPTDYSASVGFTEEIRLGQTSATTVRQRIVMRVRVLEGDRAVVPELWRGATLSDYDTRGWRSTPLPQKTTLLPTDGDWEDFDSRIWTRKYTGKSTARIHVYCPPPVPSRVFMPIAAHEVRFPRPTYADPFTDGTFRYDGEGPLEYELELGNAKLGADTGNRLVQYQRVDRLQVPEELRYRVYDALEKLDREASRREIVEACTDYLSRTYKYLLPGERGAARDLEEFVSGTGGGHCEYFATALALMLRIKQIPCRVVTGYRVSEWDESAREFLVRDAHAHAWVEAWDPEHGWISADATPAAEMTIEESGWAAFVTSLEDMWRSLIQFDADAHTAVLRWLIALPSMLVSIALESPIGTGTGLLVFVGLVLSRRRLRTRRRDPDPAREYRDALARNGLVLEPAETPRELLLRVELEPDAFAELEHATVAHEAVRYRS